MNLSEREAAAYKKLFVLIIFILFFSSFLMLFPSYSNLEIFSKGEFIFLESLGIIFTSLSVLFVLLYFILNFFFIKKDVKNKIFKFILFFLILFLSIFFIQTTILLAWIRHDVKTICQNAKIQYSGRCLDALIKTLDDHKQNYKTRNNAVFALGQLADKRALPILNKYFTGNIPSREPLNKTLSQYELKKSIEWCSEGNLTSFMFRNL